MNSYGNNSVLFEAVGKMAEQLNSLYRNNRNGKMNLLGFFEANNWFDLTLKDGKPTEITLEDVERIKKPLTLWLSSYDQPGRIKIELMLDYFNEKYPDTCRLYSRFIDGNRLEDAHSAWKLLDFILSEIDKEITDYDETELESLIAHVASETPLSIARMLTQFLQSLINNGRHSKWEYTFLPRERPEFINDAYAINNFSIMAYCVFNEDMWIRQNLVQKAVQSKPCADLWLFTALHFISAMRASDMTRLPVPDLPYDGATVLAKISDNAFTKSEAIALVDELTTRLKLMPLKPLKTSAHNNISELKLFVPESLRAPLGIIMAVALAHRPEADSNEGLVSSKHTPHYYRTFFGGHFVKALNFRRFSTRRSNKSYMQGIDAVTSDLPGKPKGYMLAALARSHKSGIGRLSETTDIYLKDANFSGYKPEFIIREMFERGVFSFIPAVLLEIYTGDKFKLIPVSAQTELIRMFGFAAHQIEWMAGAVETALIKSRAIVNNILHNPHRLKVSVEEILQNIASGNAPGRQDECLCLMTAAGLPCPYPERDICIGCGCEIYTKTAIHTLMNEYIRLSDLRKTSKSDSWRYSKMLEQAVLPAISEMLTAMKLFCGEYGISECLEIVERGLEYVDGEL